MVGHRDRCGVWVDQIAHASRRPIRGTLTSLLPTRSFSRLLVDIAGSAAMHHRTHIDLLGEAEARN